MFGRTFRLLPYIMCANSEIFPNEQRNLSKISWLYPIQARLGGWYLWWWSVHSCKRHTYCYRTETAQINCELIWVKIDMVTTKPIYVAEYYRPKEGDTESIAELRRSLDMAALLKGSWRLLGDFNYPKFSWDQEHMPSMKSGSGFPANYEEFVPFLMTLALYKWLMSQPEVKMSLTSSSLQTTPSLRILKYHLALLTITL